jgi:hypothetical protein
MPTPDKTHPIGVSNVFKRMRTEAVTGADFEAPV